MYAIQKAPRESFGLSIVLFAAVTYVFETVAECLSVWFEDPIMGMLQFMNFWFGAFLFGGFLIPLDDMIWPFELFYYIFPYSYYVRSGVYELLIDSEFSNCTNANESAVCVQCYEPGCTVPGDEILDDLGRIISLFSSNDEVAKDIGIMIAIAAFFKIMHVYGVVVKARKVAHIDESS